MSDIQHGTTYGAAQKCARRHGSRCDPCKRVAAEYMSRYRKRNPEYGVRHSDMVNARNRAAIRIAEMHPVLFHALIAEEVAACKERRDGAA